MHQLSQQVKRELCEHLDLLRANGIVNGLDHRLACEFARNQLWSDIACVMMGWNDTMVDFLADDGNVLQDPSQDAATVSW